MLYAHGETMEFGSLPKNRRAGINIIEGVPSGESETPPAGSEQRPFSVGLQMRLPLGPGTRPLGPMLLPPNLSLSPNWNPSIPTTSPFNFKLPLLQPPQLLDWAQMREPFTAHGIQLTERDAEMIERNWNSTYRFLIGLGLSPDIAVWGANKGTAAAYDNLLSRENPNFIDQSNREMEKFLKPGEKYSPIIVPIITPTSLKFITKKLFNKDVNFEF
jgi:hypothetical protein